MIIKKKNFNLTPGCRGKWPFTVSEVAVFMMNVQNPANDKELSRAFAIVHSFGVFALSGILESYKFGKLEDSGIWAIGDGVTRKSLTQFFKYLEMKV